MITNSAIVGDTVQADGLDADWFVHRRVRSGKSGYLHGVEVRYPFALKRDYEEIAKEICASLASD